MAITRKQKKELEALAALPDDQIDFSDTPELQIFTAAYSRRCTRGLKRSTSASASMRRIC